ncbi:MAG: WbqC family protein [Vicinamibacterales bacterium]|nr:WbqC family protein [Vicinamibacterales bacterium]
MHQPNVFPWLGYFNKIARSDVFIVLDHVQFPKSRPGSWTNRVQLAVNGAPHWVTVPVSRAFEGVRRIDEIRIDDSTPWRRKLLQLLRSSYGRAGHFPEVFPVVESCVMDGAPLLADYNLGAITAIAARIGVPTAHCVRSSTLGVEGAKTDLLVSLVRRVGGTAYLAGGGAGGYQDDGCFQAAGIDVQYQDYTPAPYPQRGRDTFLPGLSVLDALFHCGFAATGRLARGVDGGAG